MSRAIASRTRIVPAAGRSRSNDTGSISPAGTSTRTTSARSAGTSSRSSGGSSRPRRRTASTACCTTADSLDESAFLDYGLAVHLDADLGEDALDADPGVNLPSDHQIVPETEVRRPDCLLRLQMRTRHPSLRVQAESETAESASVLAAEVHRVDRRLRADDPARVTVRDLCGGRVSEALLEIHVDDQAARGASLDDGDEELTRGKRRDGPLPRAESRILGNPISPVQGEGEVRACGGGEMDLARAPQTAGGPPHELVDFRPIRREPSQPQHPFINTRHRDDPGAGPIRGTARMRVRQGTRRREQDQVRGRHRGPDGFRWLLAVHRAGADLEQCRVRPESLRRSEERLPDGPRPFIDDDQDLLSGPQARTRREHEASPLLHQGEKMTDAAYIFRGRKIERGFLGTRAK